MMCRLIVRCQPENEPADAENYQCLQEINIYLNAMFRQLIGHKIHSQIHVWLVLSVLRLDDWLRLFGVELSRARAQISQCGQLILFLLVKSAALLPIAANLLIRLVAIGVED